DLLDDRDQPELLAHVAACHDCQRQLFLLGRVDRALRGAAAARRKQRRRKSRWLRFPSGLVAATIAAVLVLVLFLPHHDGLRPLTLRTANGIVIGTVDADWALRNDPRWAALADDADVGPEGGDREPERLVEDNGLAVLGDAGRADVAAARDRA